MANNRVQIDYQSMPDGVGDLNPDWIINGIQPELNEWADSFAKYLVTGGRNMQLTTNQLRRFFGEMKRIQTIELSSGKDQGRRLRESIIMLEPALAYAVGRKQGKGMIVLFKKQLSIALNKVLEKPKEGELASTTIQERFNNFVRVVESIVAYHKQYEN